MKTAVPRQHLVDVASPSDTTALRNYLRTILTHLVDLHDEGKNADVLFGGGKSAALHRHFDGVVESALKAIEIVADRVCALDPHNELTRRTAVQGSRRSSLAAPTAVAIATEAAKSAADIVRRIVTVREIIGAVCNRIRDDDPLAAALLCRINTVLETQAITLQNLTVAAGRNSP